VVQSGLCYLEQPGCLGLREDLPIQYQLAVGLLVAISWVGLVVRLARHRRHREGDAQQAGDGPYGGGPGSCQ
jgi:hypothetical protein